MSHWPSFGGRLHGQNNHLHALELEPPLDRVDDLVVQQPGKERSAQAQKLMKNVLAEGLAALTQKGYSVAGHLAVGEPTEEIRVASELKCDLIAVGHKQKHSRLGRWWRGSISANLADHAPCSILIAMAPTGASHAIGPGA